MRIRPVYSLQFVYVKKLPARKQPAVPSSAERLGFRTGDIILSVAGEAVHSMQAYELQLARRQGADLTFVLLRPEKEASQWKNSIMWAKQKNLTMQQMFAQEADQWMKEHPFPFATVEDVADHIDRVVQLVGIDYVGLGSDFDGVGDSLPIGLKDASYYPNLIESLLKRGYTDEDIGKLASGNLMRVWRAQNNSK